MKLTGQAKVKITRWLIDDYPVQDVGWKWFICLDASLQWGVLQLFADSEGHELYTCKEEYNFFWSVERPDGKTLSDTEGMTPTRPEAWEEAIKKLNEILNQ